MESPGIYISNTEYRFRLCETYPKEPRGLNGSSLIIFMSMCCTDARGDDRSEGIEYSQRSIIQLPCRPDILVF